MTVRINSKIRIESSNSPTNSTTRNSPTYLQSADLWHGDTAMQWRKVFLVNGVG